MATTFQITDGTTTIDLTAACGVMGLYDYVPNLARPSADDSIPEYVTDVIPVLVSNTTEDTLATSLQSFYTLQRNAETYWRDTTYTTPVWVQCKTANETNTRRSHVKRLDLEFTVQLGGIYDVLPSLPKGRAANLILTRHPYWESTTYRTLQNHTPTAAAAVSYDYTGGASPYDVAGDVPARLPAFNIRGTVSLGTAWCGIRSANKHGSTSITSFIPIWECEAGSAYGGENGVTIDTTSASDTASPGSGSGAFIVVSPSTLDWDSGSFQRALYISPSQAGYTTGSDLVGTYLFLLRAKTASGAWSVRSTWGGPGLLPADIEPSRTFSVNSANWNFYPVAGYTFPTRNLQAISASTLSFDADITTQFSIQAHRTSGTCDLHLDCVTTIPIDEGHLFLEGAYAIAGTSLETEYGQSPHDRIDVKVYTTAPVASVGVSFSEHNFRLPPGDGRIFCSYQQTTQSVLTDQIEFADSGQLGTTMCERWVFLRGGE